MITGIINNLYAYNETFYCNYDYEKTYSVFSRVFMCKEPPDIDFILLFVIAANLENSPVEDETNRKKEQLMLGTSLSAVACKITESVK